MRVSHSLQKPGELTPLQISITAICQVNRVNAAPRRRTEHLWVYVLYGCILPSWQWTLKTTMKYSAQLTSECFFLVCQKHNRFLHLKWVLQTFDVLEFQRRFLKYFPSDVWIKWQQIFNTFSNICLSQWTSSALILKTPVKAKRKRKRREILDPGREITNTWR